MKNAISVPSYLTLSASGSLHTRNAGSIIPACILSGEHPINRNKELPNSDMMASINDSYVFFNLLTSPELLEPVETHYCPNIGNGCFHPQRRYRCFWHRPLVSDQSCQQTVDEAAIKRL